jgi:hypothetical protein
MNERPEDPQLPLYALNGEEDVSAVAFAKLRTGAMRYMGFSQREGRDSESEGRRRTGLTLFEGWT